MDSDETVGKHVAGQRNAFHDRCIRLPLSAAGAWWIFFHSALLALCRRDLGLRRLAVFLWLLDAGIQPASASVDLWQFRGWWVFRSDVTGHSGRS